MGTTHSGKYGNPGITMNIVDAIDVITEGGPTPLLSGWIVNQVAHPKMIIASKDRVACDSVALAVLKKYALAQGSTKDYTKIPVWGQRQIRHGAKKGLGTNKMPKINVKYTGLDPLEENAIKTIWEQGYSPNDSDYNIYGKPTTLLGF